MGGTPTVAPLLSTGYSCLVPLAGWCCGHPHLHPAPRTPASAAARKPELTVDRGIKSVRHLVGEIVVVVGLACSMGRAIFAGRRERTAVRMSCVGCSLGGGERDPVDSASLQAELVHARTKRGRKIGRVGPAVDKRLAAILTEEATEHDTTHVVAAGPLLEPPHVVRPVVGWRLPEGLRRRLLPVDGVKLAGEGAGGRPAGAEGEQGDVVAARLPHQADYKVPSPVIRSHSRELAADCERTTRNRLAQHTFGEGAACLWEVLDEQVRPAAADAVPGLSRCIQV